MTTKHERLAEDGDLQTINQTAPLEHESTIRSFVTSAQREFIRTFARAEQIEIPKHPDVY